MNNSGFCLGAKTGSSEGTISLRREFRELRGLVVRRAELVLASEMPMLDCVTRRRAAECLRVQAFCVTPRHPSDR
jgi:hypothetical protein